MNAVKEKAPRRTELFQILFISRLGLSLRRTRTTTTSSICSEAVKCNSEGYIHPNIITHSRSVRPKAKVNPCKNLPCAREPMQTPAWKSCTMLEPSIGPCSAWVYIYEYIWRVVQSY